MSVIDKDKISKLKNFSTASWAVWEDWKPEEMYDKILENIGKLKPYIIFLGLNRSTNKTIDSLKKRPSFINFHAPEHRGDGKLKKWIEEANLSNLRGAFMTDINEKVETDSNKVDINDIRFSTFERQLELLCQKEYHIICFGDKAFRAATRWLNNASHLQDRVLKLTHSHPGYKIHLYQVMHYSYWGDKNILPEQLKIIDDSLEN